MSSVQDIVRGKPVVLVPFKDRSGARAVAILVGNEFEFIISPAVGFLNDLAKSASHLVCYEHRDLDDFCSVEKTVYDVKLIYGGEKKLYDLAKEFLDPEMTRNILEREQRYSAHIKACKAAQVDTTRHSLLRLVPSRVIQSMLKVRAIVTMALFERALRGESGDLGTYERDTWRFARALRAIERNRIKFDEAYVTEQMKLDLPKHEAKFIRHMAESKDGYVQTLFNPCGGKTGRIKVESGFNCMGIPHGTVRKAIVSRHGEHGQILAFDYNAIDYRSIVASVPDPEFRKLYEGVDDFHSKTCEMILTGTPDKLRRDIIKYFSYVHIYGGSDATLAEKTHLSPEKVQRVKAMMDRKLRPITEFRQELSQRARREGFVLLPNGRRIHVEPDDHDGKIIGLYAQGFSSLVFEQALCSVQEWMGYNQPRESKVIFTVHDELVLDHHKEWDPNLPFCIKDLMENSVEGFVFKVNIKKGRTYSEATD